MPTRGNTIPNVRAHNKFCKKIKRKGQKIPAFEIINGGARRDRTADLCNAIAALSQLSYSPNSYESPIYLGDRHLANINHYLSTLAMHLLYSHHQTKDFFPISKVRLQSITAKPIGGRIVDMNVNKGKRSGDLNQEALVTLEEGHKTSLNRQISWSLEHSVVSANLSDQIMNHHCRWLI
jgi:hypothetical protein|tara:strand:- start:21165 stop:21701 length:537 start_codon:yes stop_codon:yes gene_type:complete